MLSRRCNGPACSPSSTAPRASPSWPPTTPPRFGELSGDELAQVLRQHLLLGPPAYTPLLVDGASYTTLAGTTLTVSVRGPDFIGGARIMAGDAIVKNGVVHTIDRVSANGSASLL